LTSQHQTTAHTKTLHAGPASGKKQSDYHVTPSGCHVTRRTQDAPASNKSAQYKKGDFIDYAEFNSDCIKRLGTRRYRLYQVAGVLNLKQRYPLKSTAEWVDYLSKHPKLEASHLCRRKKEVLQDMSDGSERTVTITEEVKACFNPSHVTMEDGDINRTRIKCTGGDACDHEPKCKLVE
jgi:hypothetical protein